jgi:hypothetical protein
MAGLGSGSDMLTTQRIGIITQLLPRMGLKRSDGNFICSMSAFAGRSRFGGLLIGEGFRVADDSGIESLGLTDH